MEGPPASDSLPQAPAPSLVGQILDRRYRLTKKLGEGGMGEVYAAEHLHIDKRFAIKVLKAEIVSNQEAVSRFYQEARSASSIGHKNIIGIEDFNQLPGGRAHRHLRDGRHHVRMLLRLPAISGRVVHGHPDPTHHDRARPRRAARGQSWSRRSARAHRGHYPLHAEEPGAAVPDDDRSGE